MDAVIDAAHARCAGVARAADATAIAFENFGDRPFFKDRVPAETVAAMTRVIAEVVADGAAAVRRERAAQRCVVGARHRGGDRRGVHPRQHSHGGDARPIRGSSKDGPRRRCALRAALAPDVLIFADHMVKHAVPLAAIDEVQSAKDLRHRGLADAHHHQR